MRRAAFLAAALAPLLLACSRAPVETRGGDRVTLHWTAFVDGKLYDTTEDGRPVDIRLGQGALPPAVEAHVIGMREGEEKTISVEGAFGVQDGSQVQDAPLEAFAALKEPLKPGMKVLGLRDGKPAQAAVTSVANGRVRLDFAHPLAGKTVGFRLRLLKIAR